MSQRQAAPANVSRQHDRDHPRRRRAAAAGAMSPTPWTTTAATGCATSPAHRAARPGCTSTSRSATATSTGTSSFRPDPHRLLRPPRHRDGVVVVRRRRKRPRRIALPTQNHHRLRHQIPEMRTPPAMRSRLRSSRWQMSPSHRLRSTPANPHHMAKILAAGSLSLPLT